MNKLTFKEFLIETPLPDSWNKEVFTKNVSFKKQIEYALERSEKIGSGSSRVAFEIDYKGRPTILKVAKNAKGLMQNQEEANILSDNMISSICIPLIDYDEESEEPHWLHCEKAEKATVSKLCKAMNVPDLHTLVRAANVNDSKREQYLETIRNFNSDNEAKEEIAMEYVDKLAELASDYDVELGDFNRAANWGFYEGEPVVIDIGFTYYTKEKYYSRK